MSRAIWWDPFFKFLVQLKKKENLVEVLFFFIYLFIFFFFFFFFWVVNNFEII